MMEANQKILDFLKECGVFFYASVDGDKARVRPFGFVMEFEDKLYFGMGDHKESYRQTVENPNVEICACKNGKWIRIRGRAVFDRRPEVQAAMFELSPFLKKAYNEETGQYHADCYLEDMEAEIIAMDGTYEKLF